MQFYLTLFLGALSAQAYIPAQPTNDTSQVSLSNDFIQLSWQVTGSSAQGVFRDSVSRQLIADNSTQVGTDYAARGALVHYSEDNSTQPGASPPWIAFINCDTNVTSASMEIDIFTEVRDSGAVAALLYSLTASACSMNEEYIVDFEKPIDVYSTTNLQAARLINSQFGNVGSDAYWYSSTHLNTSEVGIYRELNNTVQILSSAVSEVTATATPNPTGPTFIGTDPFASGLGTTDIDYSLQPTSFILSSDEYTDYDTAAAYAGTTSFEFTQRQKRQQTRTEATASRSASTGRPSSTASAGTSYLIAVLANQDAVFANGTNNSTSSSGNGNDNDNDNGGGSNMTGLAMIILYAITGCVTVMFLVVILSGAIKAIRHPERYGPRAGLGPNNSGARTRAGGITRAILDTFPVVQFGRANDQSQTVKEGDLAMSNMENGNAAIHPNGATAGVRDMAEDRPASGDQATERSQPDETVSNARSAATAAATDIDPAAVDNYQTCPICVQDFEEGEDLRILPCDARHRFHRDCIDPWLLDVSSLCPLCRLDLSDNRQQSEEDGDESYDQSEEAPAAPTSFAGRARRYLAAADAAVSGQHLGLHQQRRAPHVRDSTNSTTGSGFNRSRFTNYVRSIRTRRRSGSAPGSPAMPPPLAQ